MNKESGANYYVYVRLADWRIELRRNIGIWHFLGPLEVQVVSSRGIEASCSSYETYGVCSRGELVLDVREEKIGGTTNAGGCASRTLLMCPSLHHPLRTKFASCCVRSSLQDGIEAGTGESGRGDGHPRGGAQHHHDALRPLLAGREAQNRRQRHHRYRLVSALGRSGGMLTVTALSTPAIGRPGRLLARRLDRRRQRDRGEAGRGEVHHRARH